MRTLMLIASVAMIGSGIFCVANASAAFLSVAFIIGLVWSFMGLIEIIIGFRADFEISREAVTIVKDGVLMMFIGIVILSGQIAGDTAASVMFAMWMLIEGVLSMRFDQMDLIHIGTSERISFGISMLMVILGGYTFFNMAAFNLPATLLIGISMIAMGMRRLGQSFVIEYDRPSFVTGNEEKLREAKEEEKRALAKAKEGIREQKIAQRRIKRIEEDIEAERGVLLNAAQEREERELERRLNE
jgi:uncharacterized membrane protein HdeD (DUF308 family)